jgi:hypothetical protein
MDLLRINFLEYLEMPSGRIAQALEYLRFKAELRERAAEHADAPRD